MHRRSFLTSSAITAVGIAFSFRAAAQVAPLGGPPIARVEPFVEALWGERIVDPYRWMENRSDPDFLPSMRGQDAYARATIAAMPERPALLERIRELTSDRPSVVWPQLAGDRSFYERREANSDTYLLIAREADGLERVLADPRLFGSSSSIDWWSPSPDGQYVVIGVSQAGSEAAIGYVVDIDRNRFLPDRLDHVPYASPAWLPDGSGFYYSRFAGLAPGHPEYYLNRSLWFHAVGSQQSTDKAIVDRDTAGVGLDPISYPIMQIGVGGSHAGLLVFQGYGRAFSLYLTPLADLLSGNPVWRKIFDQADNVQDFAISEDSLFLLDTNSAPTGRILKLPATSGTLGDASILRNATTIAVDGLHAVQDGVVAVLNDVGYQSLEHVSQTGQRRPIALPFSGWIQGVSVGPGGSSLLTRITSWLEPGTIFSVDLKSGQVANGPMEPGHAFDLSPYRSRRDFALAEDGTRIPLSIIERKDRTGSVPTLVHVYGAYQWPSQPLFNAAELAFLDVGGAIATAHVRGGGEYGRVWHEGGRKDTKPNTWNDLISCCEHLIETGVSRPGQVAIYGGSAGGIAVGRALTTRPDLFGAVVSKVGMSNPLRAEFEPNGAPNIQEFGSVTDEAGFRALREMDAYHAVREGVDYPPMLLTTGINDPRVEPYNAAKMAARLQAADPSPSTLLRVEFEGGHSGAGGDASRQETADELAFVLHHCR